MKRITLMLLCLVFMGCAHSFSTLPPNKTDADWERDSEYCLKSSGKITGFFAFNPLALAINAGADKRFEQCLIDLGWVK